ncbi:MAG: squalene synthase HpnC, partial [Bacteroidota bacterium]
LSQCFRGNARNPVFVALRATIEQFQIPIDLFQSLLQAFRSDVLRNRYESFEDVLAYCSHSANPIGRLVLLLFNERRESLFSFSDRICTALQLANFWQDISIDLERDRVYIPKEDLQRFGYSEKDLFQRTCTREFRHLLKFEVDRTEKLFHDGEPLLRQVGKNLSFELRLTWNGGMRILRKIRSQEYDVFRTRPTLSKFDKAALFVGSLFRS